MLTRYLTQRDAVKWVKNFFGVKDINAARRRLQRLLQEEGLTVGAQTLKAVDGKRTLAACNSPPINIILCQDSKASTDRVQRILSKFDFFSAITS